jgi:small multidrug resistance family-3 protein
LAALAELAGCYAMWAWVRLERPAWWIAWGTASLLLFAWALTRVEMNFAGRAFAAYGGVYVAAALAWLVVVDQVRPDRWDLLGVALCLAGATVIVLAPR